MNFHQEGKSMATSTSAKAKTRTTSARLADLRVKTACRVHRAYGDAEEIRKDGLTVHKALENVRHRANKTAHDR
jgi:hypothetical protein